MSRAPELLNDLQQALAWLRARVTGQLQTDSRQVQPGDGFIAWPGGVTDGRQHVASAIERGAVACLVEQEGIQAFELDGPVASYQGLKAATAEMTPVVRPAFQVTASAGSHGHQRQDNDSMVAGPCFGTVSKRGAPWVRHGRDAGHRCAPRSGGDRNHHP